MGKRWVPLAAAGGALVAAAVFVVAPVTAQTSGTIYACIGSGRFTHVNISSPQPCASQTPVSWPGNVPGTPSPSPSTATASPSPGATASPSPSPTSAWAWCTTSTGAFFQVPDGLFGIWSGEWGSTLPQQVCANSENDWQVTFTAPAGNTSILTYPDVQLNYNTSQPPVSGLDPSATASFSETMNANSGTSAEAGFDIWVTGTGCGTARCEVMIWTDTVNRGTVGGSTDTGHSATFGGTAWELWQDGSELIWYPPGGQQGGPVYPAQMLQDLQANGFLPADAAVSQFEDGWEIASTGGQPETFQWTGYSVTGLPAPN